MSDPDAELAARQIYAARDALREEDALLCPCREPMTIVSRVYVREDASRWVWFPGGKGTHVHDGWVSEPAQAFPLATNTRVTFAALCKRCRGTYLHVWDGGSLKVVPLGPGTRASITD